MKGEPSDKEMRVIVEQKYRGFHIVETQLDTGCCGGESAFETVMTDLRDKTVVFRWTCKLQGWGIIAAMGEINHILARRADN